MDCSKTGKLICSLRKEHGLTQSQLAERMNISDRTVSKWERGLGCPDVSLLPELSKIFGVDLSALLTGDINACDPAAGNMRKLKFSVCPVCGNFLTASEEAAVFCCGRKLEPLTPSRPGKEEDLSVGRQDDEYFISSEHEMTKDHYISFVAFLTGDTLIFRKLYPEWNLQTRIPFFAHGTLLWYCTKHGLFEKHI